ncbi:MAG: hypothetical protein EOO13_17375, partial [Chitinophagaceae bacterium]
MNLLLWGSISCSAQEYFSYYLTGDYRAGAEWIEEHYDPDDVSLNYWLGELGLLSQQWETAQKGYERVLQLVTPRTCSIFAEKQKQYPLNEFYWKSADGMGVVYAKLGNVQKALAILIEASKWTEHTWMYESDKNITKHRYNLACAYALNGDTVLAAENLLFVLRRDHNYISKAAYDPDFGGSSKPGYLRNLLTNFPLTRPFWYKVDERYPYMNPNDDDPNYKNLKVALAELTALEERASGLDTAAFKAALERFKEKHGLI